MSETQRIQPDDLVTYNGRMMEVASVANGLAQLRDRHSEPGRLIIEEDVPLDQLEIVPERAIDRIRRR